MSSTFNLNAASQVVTEVWSRRATVDSMCEVVLSGFRGKHEVPSGPFLLPPGLLRIEFSVFLSAGLNVGCFYAVSTLLNRMIIEHYPVSSSVFDPKHAKHFIPTRPDFFLNGFLLCS